MKVIPKFSRKKVDFSMYGYVVIRKTLTLNMLYTSR